MLARRSRLNHPRVGEFELPLLVPAFSSKGFSFLFTGKGHKRRPYSEVAYELAEFGKRPQRAVLVSAYDVHYGHYRAPNLEKGSSEAYLKNTALIFLDSGGYELSSEFDSTEPQIGRHDPKAFDQAAYEAVLSQFHNLRAVPPLVIANYDHQTRGQPLDAQIRAARALFNRFPSFVSDFIIKPWRGAYVDPEELTPKDIANLRGFNIIGVTEKELARDLFDRIKRVAQLRKRLDDEHIDAPIHIWGGLEPIATPLLFFAGAEIFDGVSWLRYAYRNGVAIARESYCVVSSTGVTAQRSLNHIVASLDNLTSLEKLVIALQQWVDYGGNDFSMFYPDVTAALREAYQVMRARIPALKGGQ